MCSVNFRPWSICWKTPKDEIGLALMDEQLPKRVRGKSGTPSGAL